MYPGWEVEERNKVKTAENTKNGSVYSLGDLVLRAYFGSRFSIELTLMIAKNLPRSTTYITYNPIAIQQQSNSNPIIAWYLVLR